MRSLILRCKDAEVPERTAPQRIGYLMGGSDVNFLAAIWLFFRNGGVQWERMGGTT